MTDVFGEEKPACIGMFWPHGLELLINDPDMVQDLFQKYNSVFTKDEYTKNLTSDMLRRSLIWAKSEEPTYKPRRKVVSHAFYASKLQAMSDTVFEVIHERLLQWPSLYPLGEIDLVKELVEI